MTFLNQILLAGAAAFLIPLIIHLLNKRKVSVVRWGAMHLLHEVLRQRKRRFQIEQWLLLLTRIAIPIVLAFCLARPVMSALQQIPGFGKTSALLLLDDSFSMRAPSPGGGASSVADVARSDVQRVLDNLPRGSDAQVMLTGGTPRALLDQATSALDIVPKQLADVPSLSGPQSPNDVFQSATAALQKASNAAREIIFISDFQASDWKNIAEGASIPALEALAKQEPKPQVTFLRLTSDLAENLSIASAELSALVAAETQPVGLRVRVRNHGKRPWQDVAVHLEADGARLRTTRVSVPPEGEASLSFAHAFDKVGDHSLAVRIEGDSFPEDNAFFSIVQVRNQLNALLIDGDPSPEPLAGSADFLELALAPHQSAAASLKDLIRTTKVDAKRLRADDLRGKEVIIVTDTDKINRMSELDLFVKEGGGLLVFAGPNTDLDGYNREFYRRGEGMLPLAIKGYGRTEAHENPARILAQRFTHPAFTYFNDARGGRLQDAEFRHWIVFDTATQAAAPPAAGAKTQTLLSLDRGVPLVIEKAHGRGRVIAVASTASPEWANLPLQPFFVPLAQRLVAYLATQGTTPAWQLVGSPLRVALKKDQAGHEFAFTDPAGKSHDLKSEREGEGVLLASPPVATPGVAEYASKAIPGSPRKKLAFNLNTAESDLQSLAPEQVRKIAERFGAGYADSFESYQKLDRSRRHGTEFWQAFLLALLALLFIEVLLQQRISR